MARSIGWNEVTRADVLGAMEEYDRLGADQFFARHGFAPATTYELIRDGCRYPPKAILGTAYELATSQRLSPADFEGGRSGAVKVLGKLGFTVRHREQASGAVETAGAGIGAGTAGDRRRGPSRGERTAAVAESVGTRSPVGRDQHPRGDRR